MNKKIYVSIVLLASIVLFGAMIGYVVYMPNFKMSGVRYVYIHENNKNFDALCRMLRDSAGCRNVKSFELLARIRRYPTNMRVGRYVIEPGMSNKDLLDRLRRGQQTPVRLTFNNVRLTTDLAKRIAGQLMMTAEDLLSYLQDDNYCQSIGFDTNTIPALFIPNTYEVYWNISPDKLFERMIREYQTFWTDERRNKAASIGLSRVEISIVASIVEEETAAVDEYPIVAGLYINRLYKGMLLQADPTIKFAVGDFSLRRILNIHLAVDSPYNTYMYAGLPPGPIRIPAAKTIDAVLNYTHHNYLYMCAKEDFSGRHNFAVTLAEHGHNANKYHAELNRRGIK